MQQHYYVYVLRSFKDKQFYVGFTKNLPTRVEAHSQGWVPSHENQIALAPCLLGGLPQSDRRNPSRKILEDRLGKAIRENEAQELSHGVNDVSTTMIYTNVWNRGGRGVNSPADRLGFDFARP